MSAPTTIEALTAELHALPSTADPVDAGALLRRLRNRLTDGLDHVAPADLRGFATLADRFGFHADAWNAIALLRKGGELDAHARLIAARAFVELFGDVANERPHVVARLLGDDADAPSELARASLLTRWLRHVDVHLEHGRASAAASTVAAVQHLATAWWPASGRPEQPTAFTAAFIARARALANVEPLLTPAAHTMAAQAWAAALRWPNDAGDEDDGSPMVATVDDQPGEEHHLRLVDDAVHDAAERITDQSKRIWVIGGLAAKWSHLVGVAKTLGIGADVMRHVDYDEVKQRSVIDLVNVAQDVGVLIGPVPHKALDVGHHSSLVVQLQREAGIPVFDLRANDGSGTLKITKASFRFGLLQLLTEIAAARYVPVALAPSAHHTVRAG